MKSSKVKVFTGNDACAEAAVAAGLKLFAGYPITPATEIAEISSELLPQVGGRFIQMEDEIASISAIIGASMTGTKVMTATSGPGFSLMQECLGYAVINEVPCVIVDVMRVGPCQGVATVPAQGDAMQARWGTHGDHPIIALAPSTVREVYDLTVRAFNLAEKYRTPVILLSDAMLAHMSEKVVIPDASELTIVNRKKPTVSPEEYLPFADDGTGISPMAGYGDGYIWYTTGIVHDKSGFPATNNPDDITAQVDRLFAKIDKNLDDIVQAEEYLIEDAEVVIVAYGTVARAAKSAVKAAREEGIKAGLVRPITLWPFPEKAIERAKANATRFIVCEMNHGQIDGPVKAVVAGSAPVDFVGQYNGKPILPAKILSAIKGAAK